MPQELYRRSPMRVLAGHLGGGPNAGEVGVIVARTGVGKSALLVHVALDALLRDLPVLHVSTRDTVDHVRSYYDEILGAIARAGRLYDRSAATLSVERNRMIHSHIDQGLSVPRLRENLKMLAEVAHFAPKLIVIDGLAAEDAAPHLASASELAVELGIPVWLTLRTKTATVSPELLQGARLGLRLQADGRSIKLTLLSGGGQLELPFRLDPSTMLVVGQSEEAAGTHAAPVPTDCTLYSGGANGAEAAFGEFAEKWGVHEVNFTFEGHRQARSRGRYELSPRELAAGDVSLVYVSRRLRRTYSEGSLIRKVLQTLWHMVSRSQQVFVIGSVQDDGTVVGGTGWSVELAKMWNKDLWVYDQEKTSWFHWDGEAWAAGTPRIESVHWTGTGTRYLTDEGRAAVEALFERSFAPAAVD